MPFEVNPAPFRTNRIEPFDPATDRPAYDTAEPEQAERPAFWSETVPAAFRRENPVASFLQSTAPVRHLDDWDESYDVFDDLAGYEDYADRLAIARNKRHADQIKTDIDAELEAQKVLESAGGLGIVAGIGAGILSPEVLMPGGAVVRGTKGGYSLLRTAGNTAKWGAAGMAVSETALQASQQTRTIEESAINIGAGTFLAGVIGAGAAKYLGRAGLSELSKRVEKDLFVPAERDFVDEIADEAEALRQANSTVGAMQVPKETLEQNSLKGSLGLEWLTKKLNTSPVIRLMNSPSLATRQIFQALDEVPVFLQKNAEGIATEQAVTTYMKEYNSLLASSTRALNEQYAVYRKAARGQNGRFSFEQFKEAVAMALRRGDTHGNPAVEQAARAYRPTLERMKNEAIDAGLLPDDVSPQFAVSYLTRVWDPNKIQMQEQVFRAQIRAWASEKATKVMRAAQADYNRKLHALRSEVADLEMRNLRMDSEAAKTADLTGLDVQTMLQAMKEGGAPSSPQSLAAFLKTKGGLQDDEGVLRGLGITNKSRIGIISKKGMTLEQARDLAFKEGFFAGRRTKPDVNDLLEALRDEFSGVTVTVRDADVPALKAFEEYESVRLALRELGIDTTDVPGGRALPDDLSPDALRNIRKKVNSVTKKRREARMAKLREKIAEIEAEKHLEMDTRFDLSNDMEAYLDEIENTVFDTLTRRNMGEVEEGFVVSTRGPLRAKTLDIQDIEVERFLNNDIDMVMRKHVRTIAAEVELKRKFTDPTMKEQIEQVKEEYNRLRKENPKLAKELSAREKSDIEDLEMIRDVIRGTYDDGTSEGWKRLGRMARAWNYITKMGSVVVSSIPDVAGVVMKHGLNRAFGDLVVPVAKGMKGIKMQVREAKLAGHVTETVLANRIMELTDLRDPFAQGSAFERFIHNNVAPSFSKLTLMNRWNDLMKSVASAVTQTRIIEGVEALAKGKITPKEREYLAFLGIDANMARQIAAQFKEYGEVVDGLPIANTAKWDMREAQRVFRAALNKEVDSIIVTPGISDKPLMMQTELGKVVFQFRSFFFAANQRVLMRGLQQRDAAFMHGTILAVSAGMMVAWFKAKSRGEDTDDWSPQKWVAEGVDQSGIASVLLELNNTWEKAGLPGLYAALGESPASRYVNRNQTGALLGPTFGLGQDLFRAAYLVGNPSEASESDIRALRRLIPFQNLFYVRWFFDKLAEEAAEALGAA